MNKDLELALEVKKNAYSPYSNFEVGVALRCKDGKVYTGCNVENHGIQSICAERCAFVKALSEGEREFDSIVVVGGEKGKEISSECMPCGYCRQFMSEFVSKDFKIITYDGNKIYERTMEEILPNSFSLE